MNECRAPQRREENRASVWAGGFYQNRLFVCVVSLWMLQLVRACVCLCFDKPSAYGEGKKEIPLQYLKIPTGAHYCLTLTLLSPQLRIYAFRHTEPETKIELNRRKKVWRRGRKGQRRERRMCLRSRVGVRWETLLNYITVAFQCRPA